jgi:succinate-semialdehyde dehydrogenase/glutarate-semialdehyde dehydrogenase
MGFREMLKAQAVVDDLLPGVKRDLWWQPYSEGVYRGIRAIADLLGGTSIRARMRALPGAVKVFLRTWQH